MSFLKIWINHDKPNSYVNQLRRKRFQAIEQSLNNLAVNNSKFRILDVGGDIGYWKHVGWNKPNAHITLLNLEQVKVCEEDQSKFIAVKGNALALPYQKGDFDLLFSNSVIEHVGSYKNQQIFADEIRRVSDKYIIQTPSFWFPLEPHSLIPLFQFIPHSIRAVLIMLFNINYFPKAKTYREALNVSRSTLMFTKKRFRKLFPEGELYVERLFGLPKSYTIIKI